MQVFENCKYNLNLEIAIHFLEKKLLKKWFIFYFTTTTESVIFAMGDHFAILDMILVLQVF